MIIVCRYILEMYFGDMLQFKRFVLEIRFVFCYGSCLIENGSCCMQSVFKACKIRVPKQPPQNKFSFAIVRKLPPLILNSADATLLELSFLILPICYDDPHQISTIFPNRGRPAEKTFPPFRNIPDANSL